MRLWPMRPSPTVLALLALALGTLVAGCRGCGDGRAVARVSKRRGDVTRDVAAHVGAWEPAAVGAKLDLGDGLRTGADASTTARLSRGGVIDLESDTTVRFLEKAPGEAGIDVQTGQAHLEATDGELVIGTAIGVTRIESGGKLQLTATGDHKQRLQVTFGAAHLERGDGGVVDIAAGKTFEVSVGGAIVEVETDAGSSALAVDDAAAPAPKDAAESGGVEGLLAEVRNPGVRVQARGERTWKALATSDAVLGAGDTLDVPPGVRVVVHRGDRRTALIGAGQFVVGDASGALVRAVAGRVELETGSEDVVIDVPGGTIVARAADGKTRADVDATARSTTVKVRQGHVDVRGKSGTESLHAGESATLTPAGAIDSGVKPPERADFTVPAGESFTVRDPHPPTALGVDFSAVCPGAGVLSAGRASARGEKRAAIYMPAGTHTYAVRCIGPDGVEDKPAATGTVSVVADSGMADLPRSPPATVVDTDGRRYTVLYQNLLPRVIVRWADAPAGSSYVLHLDTQQLTSPKPRYEAGPGTFGEGAHTLWFEVAGDPSKRSGETTLVLRFDNAAPSASVREPSDRGFSPGATVHVSGIAVEGWTVTVNGQELPLDDQKRFAGDVTPSGAEGGLGIRLAHPKRGTVYYVRHAAGSSR